MHMTQRENKATPNVMNGILYLETGEIQVESPAWWQWLQRGEPFSFESPEGTFTARCGGLRDSNFWYGYRHWGEQLFKLYIGRPSDLTHARLVTAAQQLADQVDNSAV
jgi:hypothetical protein